MTSVHGKGVPEQHFLFSLLSGNRVWVCDGMPLNAQCSLWFVFGFFCLFFFFFFFFASNHCFVCCFLIIIFFFIFHLRVV